MSSYAVTVKTESGHFSYIAIGTSSIDIAAAAIDQFGVCAVSVRPQ